MAADASWTLEPGAILLVARPDGRLRAALADGPRAPRRPRRARRAAAVVPDRDPRDRRRADLARRPPRRAGVHDAHGPARAAARHRADRAHLRADEDHPAAGHAAPAASRGGARPDRPPAVRRCRLRRPDVGLARAGALRRRARAPVRPCAGARRVLQRRRPLLVAPAVADPQPHAADRDGPGRLHALDEAVRRPARHRADLRPRGDLLVLRAPAADLGARAVRGPGPGRRAHGARAVDRHGRRARLAVPQRARRERGRGAARRAVRGPRRRGAPSPRGPCRPRRGSARRPPGGP